MAARRSDGPGEYHRHRHGSATSAAADFADPCHPTPLTKCGPIEPAEGLNTGDFGDSRVRQMRGCRRAAPCGFPRESRRCPYWGTSNRWREPPAFSKKPDEWQSTWRTRCSITTPCPTIINVRPRALLVNGVACHPFQDTSYFIPAGMGVFSG